MSLYQGKFDTAPRSRGLRWGSAVFYILFFVWVLAFYCAVYFGLSWLQGWLTDFELAQPYRTSQEIFDTYFAARNWEGLYDAAVMAEGTYEGKAAFAACMDGKIGQEKLTCMETSAGLSENKKYVVRLGDEKIAAFTLENRNKAAETELPDWKLSSMEVFVEGDQTYWIKAEEGSSVSVNGKVLEENAIVCIQSTKAEKYLPAGISGKRLLTWEVSRLMNKPVVTVLDGAGKASDLTYGEEENTFVQRISPEEMPEEHREAALNAVKTYALYMITKAGPGELAKHFDKTSDTYKTILKSELGNVQNEASREFVDEAVTDYCRYSEDLFSVRVGVTLNLYRASGSVKENRIEQSLFFEKQESGKWLCTGMTAVDVSEETAQVRLTFQNGDRVLSSEFYSTTAAEIACPAVAVPEGKTFAGWMREKQENGETVMELVLQPDESGNAKVPAGLALEPMILCPLFE